MTEQTNEEQYLCNFLDFCGCGNPEEALKYIARHLQNIKDKVSGHITYEEYRAKYTSEGEYYFILYFLDYKNLTEHGSSVNGCWLSADGEEILNRINKLYE